MKKLVAMCIVLCALLPVAATLADGTGVQILSLPEVETFSEVDIQDMKVGETAAIEGLGELTIQEVQICDQIQYGSFLSNKWSSGSEAEYLYLNIRILNTQKTAQHYLPMFDHIRCEFGDGYQFEGWLRQRDADEEDAGFYYEAGDGYEISPLYAGQYAVVVTLPNYVIESSEPLSVTFDIGGYEFTYYHRR